MSTGAAFAIAFIVLIAVGGMIAYIIVQQRAAQARATDPAALIGGGIGGIVTGLVGLATGAGDS